MRTSVWCILYSPTDDSFLLLKRSARANNPGLWNFPGGGVEEKSEKRAAQRELYEEAGINLPLKKLMAMQAPRSKVRCVYYYAILDKEMKPRLNKESSKFAFYKVDDLKKLKLHGPTKLFFKKCVEKFYKRMAKQAKRVLASLEDDIRCDVRASNSGHVNDFFIWQSHTLVASARVVSGLRKLINVYVNPHHREKGYGSRLMAFVMNHKNFPITLEAKPGPDAAISSKQLMAFYQKWGFEPVLKMGDRVKMHHWSRK